MVLRQPVLGKAADNYIGVLIAVGISIVSLAKWSGLMTINWLLSFVFDRVPLRSYRRSKIPLQRRPILTTIVVCSAHHFIRRSSNHVK